MPTEAPNAAGGVLMLPRLFAFEEIAWLREAAIALAQREGAGAGFAPRDLHDVHRMAAGFRKLAAHPRLLGHVQRVAGGPVTLRATRPYAAKPTTACGRRRISRRADRTKKERVKRCSRRTR